MSYGACYGANQANATHSTPSDTCSSVRAPCPMYPRQGISCRTAHFIDFLARRSSSPSRARMQKECYKWNAIWSTDPNSFNTDCRCPPTAPTRQTAAPPWSIPPSPCASGFHPYETHPRQPSFSRRYNHRSVSESYSPDAGERRRRSIRPGYRRNQL